MEKICAGIITYNPNISKLKKNIDSISNHVSKIIIVDNNSKNFKEIEAYLNSDNIKIISNRENYGIAYALNEVCKIAFDLGYEWILTLDQDSISPNSMVNELKKYINDDVAIVSPNIVYKNNEIFTIKEKGVHEVNWVITSASLTNLKIWNLIKFDNILFIDGVDRDYCIRAKRKGYKILKNYDVELLHELGDLKCKKILKKTIYITNHNANRYYYMTRNVIYLDKKLNEHNGKKYILNLFIKILFFEKDKIRKIKKIIKGINDGLQMKSGEKI